MLVGSLAPSSGPQLSFPSLGWLDEWTKEPVVGEKLGSGIGSHPTLFHDLGPALG